MKNNIEKWQNDNKYKAKIKLILYGIFIFAVSIFAISANRHIPKETTTKENEQETEYNNNEIIQIPKNYHYERQ